MSKYSPYMSMHLRYIPREIMAEIHHEGTLQGITINEVVINILRRYYAEKKEKK